MDGKVDYRKKRYEEGTIPDAISSKMDILNNCIGINIGKQYPELISSNLKLLIIEKIALGELWIIKANSNGEYLNYENRILKKSDYEGIWSNDKCLVKSNYSYK